MKGKGIFKLPAGFRANGLSCGIKKNGKPDLALIVSDLPAIAQGRFTSNMVKAAPVQIDITRLARAASFRAVIANSGNANCFTGKAGERAALRTSDALSRQLGIPAKSVLLASTGIIGRPLPADNICRALPSLVRGLSAKGLKQAEDAILTTDTFAKFSSAFFRCAGKQVSICGIAKGAGMISPNMATMLAFVFTDADISREALGQAVDEAMSLSFNCITVDGCMSTNDTLIVMANKAAANMPIKRAQGAAYLAFKKALSRVCLELAEMIVRDAEGATKFISIKVSGARDFCQARKAGLAVANSSLFKAAMFGEDPNYGRVAAAIGASGADFSASKLKIRLGPLTGKHIAININLGKGASGCTIYTSDLTPEYVKINADYS